MNENKEILEEISIPLDESLEQKPLEESSVEEHIPVEDKEENETAVLSSSPKLKKHEEALILVEKAKQIVKDADEQTEACKLLLAGDLKEYEEAKSSLKSRGMDACSLLIEKLEDESDDSTVIEEEDIVIFEPKEEIAPFYPKDVSSGKFTGFVYALLGGAVTVAGLGAFAMQKLGIVPDFSKVPSPETLQSILGWFGTQVGRPDDVMNGGLVVGVATLAVMMLIYAIRVNLKGGKNLNFALKQLEEAEAYTKHKSNCKAEMDKVDLHMKETLETLKMYEVLFNEQKGKLERILYIEGDKESAVPYHAKTLMEIDSTKELLRAMKNFIDTPMSQEGKLSDKSVQLLQRAKIQMDKMIEKLY
ncbi:ORF 73; extensive acidic domains, potential leucine zipper; immediate early protein homolog [hydrothermal vent metagenome]|uniref:ORF 73 extensive acidic domains, potential leucine zipper immediate early protein homolog n=1 Tax=hydrothermal vent metagenome TaxID=652676 RepID=A0A1W1C7X1_9ZZZZ